MQANAIRISPGDNVAVAIRGMTAGELVVGVPGLEVKTREEIPRNHKVALVDISPGAPVIKYGESIGVAAVPIRAGEWVHTHNLRSGEET